nr:hypothetical protein [uncultured Chryseobacterium sp.]
MKTRLFNILLLLTILSGCQPAYINISNKITTGCADKSVNLYAFVGKKISVTEFDPNENNHSEKYQMDDDTGDSVKIIQTTYVMDHAFRCRYKVMKDLFNYLEKDTIEFIAYDHYGTPAFTEKDTVLLYVSKSKDDSYYFHQKYQYDNIFRDKKGHYFSYPKFSGTLYEPYKDSLQTFKVNLKSERFNTENLDNTALQSLYPRTHYKREKKFAYPIKGVYLYDLINYRLKTTFKNL